MFDEFSVFNANDIEQTNCYLPPRWQDSLECPLMCGAHNGAEDNPIPFGKHVFDGDLNVRKCSAEAGKSLFLPIQIQRLGYGREITFVFRREDTIGRGDIRLAPDLIQVLKDQRLVLLLYGHHSDVSVLVS